MRVRVGFALLCWVVLGCGSERAAGDDAAAADRDLVFGGRGSVRLGDPDAGAELELDAAAGDPPPELELDAGAATDASATDPDAMEPDCAGWKCWVQ